MAMYIHVTVTAGAKTEAFKQTGERRYAISVREPAKQNLANKRVIEVVARHFRTPLGKVRIISGHHHPKKLLSVDIGSNT
ncbi:MAG: DUF167 domain-containing protein [Parcubacteria group bacterium]|nr:DUF167 domain-containing protein [Parcubacteria group bacterium]